MYSTRQTAVKVKVSQSCPTLCDLMDYTVHGILQARIQEWVAFPFSRGSSQPRDQTQVSCIAGSFFISWVTREAQESFSSRSSQPRNQLESPAFQVGSVPTELSGKQTAVRLNINSVFLLLMEDHSWCLCVPVLCTYMCVHFLYFLNFLPKARMTLVIKGDQDRIWKIIRYRVDKQGPTI